MRVWLLTVGEPLPTDPGRQRLHRSGVIAGLLASSGIDVIWWTSSFAHTEKTFRFPSTTWLRIGERLRLCCLSSRPYRKNVSLARILANRDIAGEFTRNAGSEPVPDVIFASYPIPELAHAGARYAAAHGIPAVVDVRDLWPDVWTEALPRPLQPFGPIGALPFYWQSRQTLHAFQGVCGITDEIVEWGLERAGRPRGQWDRAFPLAYAEHQYTQEERAEAQRFWDVTLQGPTPPRLRLCFFGNIAIRRGRQDVMVEAMRRLPDRVRAQTQLVLCGIGEDLEVLRSMAAGVAGIVMPGWVTGPQIEALSAQSHAGILPYPSGPDFVRAIPNKAIEYLAHGLPILTSLRGPVSQLIESEGCGALYRETDADDLAARIVALFDTPEDLARLSANAQRVFRARFQAANVYGALADMLVELASVGRS
jgi:glycosyltransferase involved in cell wall biosynthesis